MTDGPAGQISEKMEACGESLMDVILAHHDKAMLVQLACYDVLHEEDISDAVPLEAVQQGVRTERKKKAVSS